MEMCDDEEVESQSSELDFTQGGKQVALASCFVITCLS